MRVTAELGLGTVQWGVPYGITNDAGQTSRGEVRSILQEARMHDVGVLDTASQYGEAETVLGGNMLDGFRVISKTPSFGTVAITAEHASELLHTFERSLTHLSCDKLYGLLIHRAEDLLVPGGRKLVAAMEALRDAGKVNKIGVSVYEGQQIDAVLEIFRPDIVQLPLSVLDQRLLRSGHLDTLKGSGTEIHVRSVFLQGLLLMPLERLPAYFEPIRPLLSRWWAATSEQGVTPTQAALAFIRDLPCVDVALVGVESVDQFRACQADYTSAPGFDAEGLFCDDVAYINPMFWKVN